MIRDGSSQSENAKSERELTKKINKTGKDGDILIYPQCFTRFMAIQRVHPDMRAYDRERFTGEVFSGQERLTCLKKN